jgi:cyclophilin family peptidyl-prolyl cis-trans isomerase/HEAT repeat protein
MIKRISFWAGILVLASQLACVPVKEENMSDIEFDITDTLQQKILDFQDYQITDSLIIWMQHQDATYRYLATRAFGSIKDHSELQALVERLDDEVMDVRLMAAYALGQSGNASVESDLIKHFDSQDTNRISDDYNAEILEALGKVGSENTLKQIATVSTYRPDDTTLLKGQAWSLYRFGLRDIIAPEGTERMVEFIKGQIYPLSVRWIASNYLMRVKNIDLQEYSAVIASAFRNETDSNIKMCLALALGKCNNETSRHTLSQSLSKEPDYRVKTNILRGLLAYDLSKHAPVVFDALKSPSLAVSQTAALVVYEKGNTEDANDYKKMARDTSLHWSVRASLYKAAQRHLPFYYSISKGSINWDLTKWMATAKDPYVIGAIVQAFSADPKNYGKILSALDHEHPFVSTTAAISLKDVLDHPEFDIVIAPTLYSFQKSVNDKVKEKIIEGDAGLIAELCAFVDHKRLQPRRGTVDQSYLDTVLMKISLPEQIETYNALTEAISRIKKTAAPKRLQPNFNHPIDWSVVNKLTENSHALVETSRGMIKIGFLPNDAPGSVVNFIDLSERGYFDGKNFHRVVPNFVIQGGCPRGDGYGSLNYSIRSELSHGNRYDLQGKVGMASAGNHTECTQWFITHAPTPHLDGNYTIFAEVLEGMDVVHQIQQGDVIHSIKINH